MTTPPNNPYTHDSGPDQGRSPAPRIVDGPPTHAQGWGPDRQPGLLGRKVLDEQVDRSRTDASIRRAWTATSTWLAPLALLIGLIAVITVFAHAVERHLHGSRTPVAIALQFAAEAALLGGVLWFARPVARAEGGYRAAFGLGWITRQDWLPWITGIGMVFFARIAVVIVADGLSGGNAGSQASNVHLTHPTIAKALALGVVVVILAPLTEELVFRGILLRAAMHRMPFWPAAALSTLVFAGLHAYEVTTVTGALTLVAIVGVLGLTNCYLVRITGRLAPGMMVHATFNLLAVLVLLARAH